MQNYFSVSYRSPDHVSPVCVQCSRDCQAGFNLYPLHSLLNTAASMNLLESQSDKASALPQTPKVSYLRQNKSQNDLTMVYKARPELTHRFSLPPLLSSAPGSPFGSLRDQHTPAPGTVHTSFPLMCSLPHTPALWLPVRLKSCHLTEAFPDHST